MNWLTGLWGRGCGSCQRVKWQRRAGRGIGPGGRLRELGQGCGAGSCGANGTARLGTAMAARSAQVGRRRGPGLPGPFTGKWLLTAARRGRARPGVGLPRPGTRAENPLHSQHGPWLSASGRTSTHCRSRRFPTSQGPSSDPFGRLPPPPAPPRERPSGPCPPPTLLTDLQDPS